MAEDLLKVEGLKQYYPASSGLFGKKTYVKAVDDVDFEVKKGEVFGIVGESGCGKSTLGKAICKLIEPTDGKIILDGEDIRGYDSKKMRSVRKKVQMVFQDPYASLNPRMSIHDILAEPLVIHGLAKGKQEIDEAVVRLLREVGMDDYHARRYPHEFSGGQRQRIGIARALAVRPQLIIADEPVSALDVSIQSQVLNLMSRLKKEFNLTYIFIAHDLSVVEHISDRIGVMYLGNFVEEANKENLYKNPMHPYTKALLSAIPVPDPDFKMERIPLKGELTSPINPEPGCRFAKRCPYATEGCTSNEMTLKEMEPGHFVSCRMVQEQG